MIYYYNVKYNYYKLRCKTPRPHFASKIPTGMRKNLSKNWHFGHALSKMFASPNLRQCRFNTLTRQSHFHSSKLSKYFPSLSLHSTPHNLRSDTTDISLHDAEHFTVSSVNLPVLKCNTRESYKGVGLTAQAFYNSPLRQTVVSSQLLTSAAYSKENDWVRRSHFGQDGGEESANSQWSYWETKPGLLR
jgi:hypothetical protein